MNATWENEYEDARFPSGRRQQGAFGKPEQLHGQTTDLAASGERGKGGDGS